jgi:hypothetical protein
MRTIFGSRRAQSLMRFCILLITAALIAFMAGCEITPTVEIRDWHDLNAVRDNLGGRHILMNDLDSTTAGYEDLASPTANEGKGWQPIGVWRDGFTGRFDGRGYEIRNLFINRPDEDDVGLFGDIEQSGIVKNTGVMNATVIGQNRVGGLAGYNSGGTVSNSYYAGSVVGTIYQVGGLLGANEGTVTNSYSIGNVTGREHVGGLVGGSNGSVSNSHSSSSVTGNWAVGGLVGISAEGTVTDSHSTGNVTGKSCVAGLVGANGVSGPGTVTNCYSTGSVTGESYVGGLVGGHGNHGSTVGDSHATGSVAGNLSVGGLVGGNQGGTVTDSYSSGNVTGVENVGGLVGENLIDGTVSNSYSTGSVTGESYVGGLVGLNEEGTVSNSFWDIETSGRSTSDGGTGKTTAQMKKIATFSGATWNIVAVANPGTRNSAYFWNIVDDETYPFLSWEA